MGVSSLRAPTRTAEPTEPVVGCVSGNSSQHHRVSSSKSHNVLCYGSDRRDPESHLNRHSSTGAGGPAITALTTARARLRFVVGFLCVRGDFSPRCLGGNERLELMEREFVQPAVYVANRRKTSSFGAEKMSTG